MQGAVSKNIWIGSQYFLDKEMNISFEVDINLYDGTFCDSN